MTVLTRDSDVVRDFDVLDERAEQCGRRWAVRTFQRFREYGIAPPLMWDGKPADAMRFVESFAGHVSLADRRVLEEAVQEAAADEWQDQMRQVVGYEPMAAE